MGPDAAMLASQALVQWQAGQFTECLQSLDNMQVQLDSNQEGNGSGSVDDASSSNHADAAVALKLNYNRTLVRFASGGSRDLHQLLEDSKLAIAAHIEHKVSSVKEEEANNNNTNTNNNMNSASDTVTIASLPSPEDHDLALMMYNMAVALVRARRYYSAIQILEAVFEHVATLDANVALCTCFLLLDLYARMCWGRSGIIVERLAERSEKVVEFLEQPRSFNGGIDGDSTADGNGDGNADDEGENGGGGKGKSGGGRPQQQLSKDAIEFKFRLHLFKARMQLLQANVKGSKKELKTALEMFNRELKTASTDERSNNTADSPHGTGISSGGATASKFGNPQQDSWLWLGLQLDVTLTGVGADIPGAVLNTPALVLKANLEFLRGNYKKSVKLLASCARAGLHNSFFFNNIACLHHQFGQHQTATMYLSRALDSLRPPTATGGKSKGPLGLTGTDVTPEVLYNLGLQLLFAGKAQRAFACFSEASLSLYNRPRLWLRMSECVVQAVDEATRERLGENHNGHSSGALASRGLVHKAGSTPQSHSTSHESSAFAGITVDVNNADGPNVFAFTQTIQSADTLRASVSGGAETVSMLLPGAREQLRDFLQGGRISAGCATGGGGGNDKNEKQANKKKKKGSTGGGDNKSDAQARADSVLQNGLELAEGQGSLSMKTTYELSLNAGIQATFNVTHLLDVEAELALLKGTTTLDCTCIGSGDVKDQHKTEKTPNNNINTPSTSGGRANIDNNDSDGEDKDVVTDAETAATSNVATRLGALLSRSYLCLCAHHPALAMRSAQEYLALSVQHPAAVPSSFHALAHTYLAEAALYNDDVTLASVHVTAAFDLRATLDGDHGSSLDAGKSDVARRVTRPSRGDLLRVAMCSNVAALRVAQGELTEAERLYRQAIQIVPNATEALRGLLFLYIKRGQKDAALSLLKTRRVIPMAVTPSSDTQEASG